MPFFLANLSVTADRLKAVSCVDLLPGLAFMLCLRKLCQTPRKVIVAAVTGFVLTVGVG